MVEVCCVCMRMGGSHVRIHSQVYTFHSVQGLNSTKIISEPSNLVSTFVLMLSVINLCSCLRLTHTHPQIAHTVTLGMLIDVCVVINFGIYLNFGCCCVICQEVYEVECVLYNIIVMCYDFLHVHGIQ